MSILIRNRKPIEVDFDAEKLPLLRRMLNAAPFRLRWDYTGWRKGSSMSPYTQTEWNQTLTTKINEISAQIHKSTLKGGADMLVISSEILSILEDNEYIKFDGDRIFLSSRYEIIVNKYLSPHHMIVCKVVSNEEDWFKNPKLMGVITVDGIGNVDAEAELTTMLSEQVAGEIDREILSGLRNAPKNRKYLLID